MINRNIIIVSLFLVAFTSAFGSTQELVRSRRLSRTYNESPQGSNSPHPVQSDTPGPAVVTVNVVFCAVIIQHFNKFTEIHTKKWDMTAILDVLGIWVSCFAAQMEVPDDSRPTPSFVKLIEASNIKNTRLSSTMHLDRESDSELSPKNVDDLSELVHDQLSQSDLESDPGVQNFLESVFTVEIIGEIMNDCGGELDVVAVFIISVTSYIGIQDSCSQAPPAKPSLL